MSGQRRSGSDPRGGIPLGCSTWNIRLTPACDLRPTAYFADDTDHRRDLPLWPTSRSMLPANTAPDLSRLRLRMASSRRESRVTVNDIPMSLSEITVSNLRCIEHAELRLAPGLTLIHGGNGSGKTSLLEGVFILGRGRSFRSRNSERLIRRGQDQMRVTGQVRRSEVDAVRLGFEVSRTGTTARVANEDL